MLSLPQKPWQRVTIVPEAGHRYRVTVVSALATKADFDALVLEDLPTCLGEGDALTDASWDTRSVTLATRNLPAFERRLILERIAVERR